MALSILTVALLISSCNKDGDDDDQKTPEITSIGDGSAAPGDTVSISGKNFSDKTADVDVMFGTTAAIVLNTTKTTIEVEVPNVAPGSVEVKATVSGKTSSAFSFNVLSLIELEGFSPKTIKFDSVLTIKGKHFTNDVEVFVNGKLQTKDFDVSEDGTTITVKMEAKTYSGVVEVKQGNDVKAFDEELDYELSFGTPTVFSDVSVTSIAFLDDGTSYAAYENLYKLDKSGKIVDTVVKKGELYIDDLYRADNGDIYLTDDFNPGILKIKNGSSKIDTLVLDDDKFPENYLSGVCANESQDTLYVASYKANGVAMVDLSSGSADVSIIASGYSSFTYDVALRGDSVFVLSGKGVSKFHKKGETPEYILSGNEYQFGGGGLLLFKETQEIFIAGGGTKNLYHLSKNGKVKQIFSEDDLDITYSIFSVTRNKEGDIFITSNNIIKIAAY